MTETVANSAGSWGRLLGPEYLGTSTVLAGGVALYATNEFITISLLPSTVADIGGERLYAWVTTVYLVGSVVAATTVSAVLLRLGPRLAYLLGLAVFGAGSVVCAAAPTMEILLAGRILQGVAGGLLAGLGYAVINAVLPRTLWTRASALVSVMWGVGTLLGPAAGGLFAQFGMWRWAFGTLVIPVLPRNVVATAGLLAAGAALVVVFLFVDRRVSAAVLPPSAFGPGPLKWIYLTLGLLMAATMANMYVPLFGQRLAHLAPVLAGFLGAAVAIGWTISEIVSASMNTTRVIVRTVAVAPLVMAVGLAVAAFTQFADAPAGIVVVWAVALLIAGAGIGAAWPHLSAWAMGCVDDPAEGGAAAAAINTVQLMCAAFGAGLAGVVVNIAEGQEVTAARWLFGVFAALAAVALVASFRAIPTGRSGLRSGLWTPSPPDG